MADGRIKIVTRADCCYPELLDTIGNPPAKLYYAGDISIVNMPCLAIVGSRKATPYGRWAAFNIAKHAAEHGVVIVSGMATGIDTCGHLGALEGGGKTISVLGCGPDICYPNKNKELMSRIERLGLILSEYPPGRKPAPWQFPARNRIISGLAYAVLVVEADLDSGSLITAGNALEQGREVFAVPGNINSIYSRGTNKLIQDGATPLTSIDDILDLLSIRGNRSYVSKGNQLSEEEKEVLNLIAEYGMLSLDRLCVISQKPPSKIGAIVTILEMKSEIKVSMGKIHVAK